MLVVYGINSAWDSDTKQGLIFLLFGSGVAIGALFSWAYLPDVQRRVIVDDETGKMRLENKTLEDLGEGRQKARQGGEVVTVKEKWEELRRRRVVRLGRNREPT